MELYQDELSTPVGLVYVVSDGINLRAVDFEGYESRLHQLLVRHYSQYTVHAKRDPTGVTSCLKDYFAGDLAAINHLPIATNGTTFQKQVWSALRQIPAGVTVSYGTIAQRIGQPKACRAVGLANASNPIGIVVPCHRVVGSNKTLTGYGGGLERKQWLLEHEATFTRATVRSLFSDGVESQCE